MSAGQGSTATSRVREADQNNELQPKGGDIEMPTLQHLIDELRKLRVNPEEIRIKGKLYDELIEDADDVCEDED